MSTLSTSLIEKIKDTLSGTLNHVQYKGFFKRIEPSFISLRNSDALDAEDTHTLKLGTLLYINPDLIKDGAFIAKVK